MTELRDNIDTHNEDNNGRGREGRLVPPPANDAEGGAAVAVAEAAEATKSRMALTPEEIARALEIKQAVEEDERIDSASISDFEFVQWALTTLGDSIDSICERVFRLQCFKTEYTLEDSWEDGIQILHQFADLQQPGFLLAFVEGCAFDYYDCSNFNMAVDMARFNPRTIQTYHDFRVYLGGMFYLWQAGNCNFKAMREGLTVEYECMNVTTSNIDRHVSNKFLHEFFLNYPKNGRYLYLNSSMNYIMFWGDVHRTIIPRDRRMAYRFGLQGPRLDTIYDIPSPLLAREKAQEEICKCLRVRYNDQEDFRLETEEDQLMRRKRSKS